MLQEALKKLCSFVIGSVFEIHVGGIYVAVLVQAAVKVCLMNTTCSHLIVNISTTSPVRCIVNIALFDRQDQRRR